MLNFLGFILRYLAKSLVVYNKNSTFAYKKSRHNYPKTLTSLRGTVSESKVGNH